MLRYVCLEQVADTSSLEANEGYQDKEKARLNVQQPGFQMLLSLR